MRALSRQEKEKSTSPPVAYAVRCVAVSTESIIRSVSAGLSGAGSDTDRSSPSTRIRGQAPGVSSRSLPPAVQRAFSSESTVHSSATGAGQQAPVPLSTAPAVRPRMVRSSAIDQFST
jgi:hypothetical protein